MREKKPFAESMRCCRGRLECVGRKDEGSAADQVARLKECFILFYFELPCDNVGDHLHKRQDKPRQEALCYL